MTAAIGPTDAVHPHGRGDHARQVYDHSLRTGSSSHAWGPHRPPFHLQRDFRFILTCVGTTRTNQSTSAGSTVHPHMRGDHSSFLNDELRTCGSSSHAWGPRSIDKSVMLELRFILTCVGTTADQIERGVVDTVHPHMRGDHLHATSSPASSVGSSSHAWGPRRRSIAVQHEIRFILTCVGTTTTSHPRSYPDSVHPHMRGDHGGTGFSPALSAGSSSHAWGPPQSGPSLPACSRFILTCVGTTPA